MHIGIPYEQYFEWKNAGIEHFEMMRIVEKLGGPVKVHEDRVEILGMVAVANDDKAGFVHLKWED